MDQNQLSIPKLRNVISMQILRNRKMSCCSHLVSREPHVTSYIRLIIKVHGVPKKMSISKKGAKLTNGHFFGTPGTQESPSTI